jgi:hypothetical protein
MRIRAAIGIAYMTGLLVLPPTTSASLSNRTVGSNGAQDSKELRPLRARSRFATYQYGIAVRVPAGLYYCPIPEDWVGADHGRSLYLIPPTRCDSTAGYVLGPVSEPLPRIDLYYSYNVAEAEYPDGERPARTAAELMRQDCARPRRLRDVTLLGQPALACEKRHDAEIDVVVSTPYDLEPRAEGDSPDAQLSVTLVTTPARIASDRATFNAFVRNVYQCAAQWDSGKKSFWVGAAPARPACPRNAFW